MRKLTWITEQRADSSPQSVSGRGVGRSATEHKKVRKHAAHMSAAQRLATIKQKNYDEIMEIVRRRRSSSTTTPFLETSRAEQRAGSEDAAAGGPPPWFILRLLGESSWYQTAVQMNSLGQKSTRNILWSAVIHNTSLFQCAIMAAGTYSNTCGLPPSAIHTMGTGLIHLRSASLQAVQSAIAASTRDSLTAVAVALLAGWERGCRFGDDGAYEMHMNAWRRMNLPPTALEEENVDTLVDAVMELFKENLNDIAALPSGSLRPQYPTTLPPGFRIFSLARPETRSLLDIVSRIAVADPEVLGALPGIREFCVQAIGWGASHSVSEGLEIVAVHEEGWEWRELKALYHIRAVCVSLNAVLHMVAQETGRVHWSMDHAGALVSHTSACQHLNTEALIGTKFAGIALWARFMMCVVSRDPARDSLLRRWMRMCGVEQWEELEGLLGRHIDLKGFLGERTRELWGIVMGRSEDLKLAGWD